MPDREVAGHEPADDSEPAPRAPRTPGISMWRDPREFRPASANRRAALLLIGGLLLVVIALVIRAALG